MIVGIDLTSEHRFTVRIEPVGKGRHRTTKSGHTYTPASTTKAQEAVLREWQESCGHRLDWPLTLQVDARFAMPRSWSMKKRREMYGTPCTKRPDGDNVFKLVADALNGAAYHDDSQIVDGRFTKAWADEGSIAILLAHWGRQ